MTRPIQKKQEQWILERFLASLGSSSPGDLQALQLEQQRLHTELSQALSEWESVEAEISDLERDLSATGPDEAT